MREWIDKECYHVTNTKKFLTIIKLYAVLIINSHVALT